MGLPELKIKYDGDIAIATGASRTAKKWVNTTLKWSEFVSRLSVPLRTSETVAEYKKLPKPKRDQIKDVGGFVGGTLEGGRRKADSVISRSLVTLDLDEIPAGVDVWPVIDSLIECAAALYSTHSSAPNAERLRLVVPLSREVSPDEYGAISRRLADDIGIDYCDDTTYEPSRLMYWASCPLDADYIFKYSDGPFLDADEILASYKDWQDVSEWPVSSRRDQLQKNAAKKQGNPLEKNGVLGAFCKVYDIKAAIDTFLPEVYLPTADPNRMTYAEGSTIGGLVLYDDMFAYSHHGTDPISGKLVNSFDLVRLHMFRDLDIDEIEGTLVTKLPSYKAMCDFALKDDEVKYQLAMDNIDGAFDDISEDDPDTDWVKKLEVTNKGAIAGTIDNVRLILLNDPRLNTAYYYDAFKVRPIVSADLPWIKFKDRVSPVWIDSDDAGLRWFIESNYHVESASKIKDAVELAMLEHVRHPVREYLNSLLWDGEERLDTLFIKYNGAEDSEYTRAVTRAALVGAVARIMKPGCKHDHMIVLIGPQGSCKSTTLAKLGKEWFSDSLYTMSGKDAYEQVIGYWIIELAEMAATRKAEVEQTKNFVSKQSDNFRAAYAKRTQDHPRQCAFFGTTNDDEFLRDATGARRFWPVVVDYDIGRRMASELTADIVDQVWAEALDAYTKGEKWYLSGEIEKTAKKIQAAHTEDSGMTGVIEEFLNRKIPSDWDDRTFEERKLFWNTEGSEEDLVARDKVCAIEIWCELLNGNPKDFKQQNARDINKSLSRIDGWNKCRKRFGAGYGFQRGYEKR